MNMEARRRPAETIDREALRASCAGFARQELAPRWEAATRERTFPREFYVAAAKAGLIGIAAPAALGGSDLGSFEEAILIEECCKIDPGMMAGLIVQGVAGGILHEFGTPAQQEIVRRNIAGECLLAIAVTEPEAGNDIQNLKTTATRDGDEWVLDGMKSFITIAGEADILVLLAQTDPAQGRHGMCFFAVDRNSRGLTMTKIDTYVNLPSPTYAINLDKVRVTEAQRIPAGFRQVMASFNRERILVAARWLGHMQHTLDWALGYAKERHQFGRPIGANQSIAFSLAQAKVDVEATRCLTYQAATQWDSGAPIRDIILPVSVAKLFATQAVMRVTQTALHVGGGWGLTKDLPVMHMATEALVAPVTVGSFEIQLRAIARELGLPCD